MKTRVLIAGLCFAFLVTSGEAASTSRPVKIDRDGIWTLARLGYGRSSFGVPATFEYRLPKGTRQGHGRWYGVRLHFRIMLTLRQGEGETHDYVYAALDGHACVLMEFTVSRNGATDMVEWVSGGSFAGGGVVNTRLLNIASNPSIDVVYRNFCPFGSARPGSNRLSVSSESLEGPEPASIVVFNDSAIERTRTHPLTADRRASRLKPAAGLTAVPPQQPVVAGTRFTVPFLVSNNAERTVNDVRVRARAYGAEARLAGEDLFRLASLGGLREAQGSFAVEALRPGKAHILVRVVSAPQRKSALVIFPIAAG